MIEMRWLTENIMQGGTFYIARTLQYRQKYDPTVYAGMYPPLTAFPDKQVWSEWRNVPEVPID